MEARKDLEVLLGKQVYIELYVRVLRKWRDREKYIREFCSKNKNIFKDKKAKEQFFDENNAKH